MRASTIAGLLITFALHAGAGQLDRLDQVDLIELEARTSRALLVVLLDDDRVNTRQAVKLLFKKVNNYVEFVRSGQLQTAAPEMNQALPPKLVVYGPRDASPGEMQNLAGLKLAGQKAGFEVEVRAYVAGIQARPVQIKPPQRAA